MEFPSDRIYSEQLTVTLREHPLLQRGEPPQRTASPVFQLTVFSRLRSSQLRSSRLLHDCMIAFNKLITVQNCCVIR